MSSEGARELDVTIYYDSEDAALSMLVDELDELGVAYDECRLADIPLDILGELRAKAGSRLVFPVVWINGEVLVRPTSANVMSSIMHARSGGFYQ